MKLSISKFDFKGKFDKLLEANTRELSDKISKRIMSDVKKKRKITKTMEIIIK